MDALYSRLDQHLVLYFGTLELFELLLEMLGEVAEK
jgi:hypothetical protein